MPVVVGVAFKRAGKVYYFDPDSFDLKIGDKVVVKTSRGMEYGEIVTANMEVPDEEISAPLKKVVRIATDEDKEQYISNKEKEKEAYGICEEKIAKHGLPMKLIDVEYVFDRTKIIFYFTADGRVDFRELVKDLAAVFKTRIELRQIGVRDEAKMVGGLGPCGQRLCCTVFLGDFEPVSIRMAKEQDLPLNPLKISGICGRLMCCLKYEYETYVEFKKRAPRKGTRVNTEYGVAKIVEFNVPKETIIAELESGQRLEMPLKQALECACKVKCHEECGGNGSKPESNDDIDMDISLEKLEELEDRRYYDEEEITTTKPKRNYAFDEEAIAENEGLLDKSIGELNSNKEELNDLDSELDLDECEESNSSYGSDNPDSHDEFEETDKLDEPRESNNEDELLEIDSSNEPSEPSDSDELFSSGDKENLDDEKADEPGDSKD